jgi:hypothetical protein
MSDFFDDFLKNSETPESKKWFRRFMTCIISGMLAIGLAVFGKEVLDSKIVAGTAFIIIVIVGPSAFICWGFLMYPSLKSSLKKMLS